MKAPRTLVILFIFMISSLLVYLLLGEIEISKITNYYNKQKELENTFPHPFASDKHTLEEIHNSKDKDITIFLWNSNSMVNRDWTGITRELMQSNSDIPLFSSTSNSDTISNTECSVPCYFTSNFDYFSTSQQILFDPVYYEKDNWRRVPISIPEKLPHQRFSMFHYNSDSQYTIQAFKEFSRIMDSEISFKDKSITLACPPKESWSTKDTIKLLMDKHVSNPWESRKKDIVFVSSNCNDALASVRTNRVKQLLKYLSIDSLGTCLNNEKGNHTTIPPKDSLKDIYDRIQTNMNIYKDYKFVITFENDNSTNYITDKVYTSLYAGAIPIFMGSDKVGDWVPSGSIVNVGDYKSIKDVAQHIKQILEKKYDYKKYFEWKERAGLEDKVVEKIERCINSETNLCKMCERLNQTITAKQVLFEKYTFSPDSTYSPLFIEMYGKGDHIQVTPSDLCKSSFDLTTQYTLMAWVKPSSFGDQRIIDKNRANSLQGFNFDIQKSANGKYGLIRLCAGNGCYESKKALSVDIWYHVAVVFSTDNPDVHDNRVKFYINGVFDTEHENFAPTTTTKYPLLIGKSASMQPTDSGTYQGFIDNVMIFNRSLSAVDVNKFIWNQPYGNEEGLILFYDFNSNTKYPVKQSTVFDRSICRNNGYMMPGKYHDVSQKVIQIGKDITFNKCI
ncbi:hypothetical protein CYY_003863 [Polysphondylium violaceum]|uniref:Fucosyltransferase n=1 Tax=Polysphondylium violaceum TaxID=133409 RepID=A0A8J4V5N8_9MYCE|nr:hypothetical protein CYY_003863 [Polysphondylium violaceum]